MFTLTGLCMVMSAVLYHILCPGDTIRLPCADGLLVLHYGWCFWSNLVLGEYVCLFVKNLTPLLSLNIVTVGYAILYYYCKGLPILYAFICIIIDKFPA